MVRSAAVFYREDAKNTKKALLFAKAEEAWRSSRLRGVDFLLTA
jgi:hypothetical protein